MNNKNIILSIIIPLYNDEIYILDCIKSVIINKSNNFEILISDDVSTDSSLNIIKSIKDPRIRIISTPKAFGAAKNWSYALNAAKGKYVYFLAGDDYLSKGILDKIIPNFDGKSHYIAPMSCFNDKDGKIFEEQATIEKFHNMFDGNEKLSYQLMKWINHDELVLSFFVRKKMLIIFNMLPYSSNSIFWYWVFVAFYNTNVKNLTDTVLFKRYNHIHKREYWTSIRSQNSLLVYLKRSYIFRSLCDIYNIIIISKYFNSLKLFFHLLFLPRKTSDHSGGLLGFFKNSKKHYYEPGLILIFLFSIPISIIRFINKITNE